MGQRLTLKVRGDGSQADAAMAALDVSVASLAAKAKMSRHKPVSTKGGMFIVGFDVMGEEQVRLGITRVRVAINDFRPLWELWRNAFYQAETELFASEGTTGRGGHWQALSPPYRRWKQAHFGDVGILVASGAMRASLTGSTGDSVYEAGPRSFEIGTNRLAGYHFAGNWKLPVRRAIDIGAGAEKRYFEPPLHEWAVSVGALWGGGGAGLRPGRSKGAVK